MPMRFMAGIRRRNLWIFHRLPARVYGVASERASISSAPFGQDGRRVHPDATSRMENANPELQTSSSTQKLVLAGAEYGG